MTELQELHKSITQEIIQEREQEIKQSISTRQEMAKQYETDEKAQTKALSEAGIDISRLMELDRQSSEAAEKRVASMVEEMNRQSEKSKPAAKNLDVSASLVPNDAYVLTPSWMASFSDHDEKMELARSSAMAPQDVVTGGGCQDYWNWAKGAGWGCTGGVGENQQWAEWGFWFRPPTSKHYSIQPHFQFRGYYIVQADDKWHNCKYARVVVSAWTNVHQYNWKGWNHVNVLDVGNDNINVNNRFDTDRHTYNSYLLGGGDWAYIRCTIGLYVYAKGSGSHARNDFSTGTANTLCVPHVHVW